MFSDKFTDFELRCFAIGGEVVISSGHVEYRKVPAASVLADSRQEETDEIKRVVIYYSTKVGRSCDT